MKLILIQFVLVGLFVQNIRSQDTLNKPKITRGSVYFELGGNAIVYATGYDYLFLKKNKFKSSLAVGLSSIPGDFFGTVVSPSINVFYGQNSNIEFGAGYSYILSKPKQFGYPIHIGYRYQKDEGGLFFKASLLTFFLNLEGVFPWGGLTIGYTLP